MSAVEEGFLLLANVWWGVEHGVWWGVVIREKCLGIGQAVSNLEPV